MDALIIGSAGQDGRLLGSQLVGEVVGLDREADRPALEDAIKRRPREIYYLAAHHQSSEESRDDVAELFEKSFEVNVHQLVFVLEAVRRWAPDARLFYASSSHVFGRPTTPTQNEATPRRPDSPYAITKAAGMEVVRFYRESHGIHASSGILYNHESPHRSEKFVSMRIALAARRFQKDRSLPALELGSLAAVVDWGWAPDYTDAMQRIVRADQADDYVVATGVPHTVAELADAAFSAVGLSYREHVVEKEGIVKRAGVPLIGDATRLRERTGWGPSISFEEMVARLVAGA